MPSRPTLFGLAIAVLAIVGCGGPQVLPVKGQVKFADGSDPALLAGYVVTFQPGGGGASGTGTIKADGTFTVSTFGDQDGAVPGRHEIGITQPGQAGEGRRPKPVIDRRYGHPSGSSLAAEIKPGQQEVTLVVERLK